MGNLDDGQRTYHFDVPVADLQRGWNRRRHGQALPTRPSMRVGLRRERLRRCDGLGRRLTRITLSTSSIPCWRGLLSPRRSEPVLSGSRVVVARGPLDRVAGHLTRHPDGDDHRSEGRVHDPDCVGIPVGWTVGFRLLRR